jgi:hypothetical protein
VDHQPPHLNGGVRWDWFISAVDPENLPASTWNSAVSYARCSDGLNSLSQGCVGSVTNWKDVSPRVGLVYDVFGTGKHGDQGQHRPLCERRRSRGRQHHRQQQSRDHGRPDRRARVDGSRQQRVAFDAGGTIQLNELTPSTSTPSFGRNIPSSTITDPAVLEGVGATVAITPSFV